MSPVGSIARHREAISGALLYLHYARTGDGNGDAGHVAYVSALIHHSLHVVRTFRLPSIPGVDVEEVATWERRITAAVEEAGRLDIDTMPEPEYDAIVNTLRVCESELADWETELVAVPIANPEPLAVPALSRPAVHNVAPTNPADSIAEPDGPTPRGGFRWRGVTCDDIGSKQRLLIHALWDVVTGSPRESVPLGDVVRAVYGEGASVGERYRALMGVRGRLNVEFMNSKLRIEVKVANGRMWLSPL